MTPRIEHANFSVRDVDAMIRFLRTAFPQFRVRHDSGGAEGPRWVHVGTDEVYVALSEATVETGSPWAPYSGEPGVNHVGFEVDDVDALGARLRSAGYRDSSIENAHPHRKRVYFNDPEGNDWEFVEYHTNDPAERNDYELPG